MTASTNKTVGMTTAVFCLGTIRLVVCEGDCMDSAASVSV